MKLLVDNQLPLRLAAQLRGWGLDATHVFEVGLNEADDAEIWRIASEESQIVVSKDEDFLILANRPGDTGRFIWVRLGNCRNAHLLAKFDGIREAIQQFSRSGQRVLEIR